MILWARLLLLGLACASPLSFASPAPVTSSRVDANEDESARPADYTNHVVVAFEKNCFGFEKLEEFLQDELPNEEDIETNMRAAEGLLESELKKPAESQDAILVRALKQFVALTQMDSCNHESYETLAGLKAATRYQIDRIASRKSHRRGPLRRIELIMSKFALSHALKCKNVYPKEFDASYANLIKLQIDRIDAFMSEMIDARLKASGGSPTKSNSLLRRVLLNFMDKNDSFKSFEDARLALKFIMNRKPNQSKVASTGEENLLKGMVLEGLIEPCKYYTQHMGADIFIPAQLDAGVLDRANRFKPSFDEQHDSFIYGWARFGFCTMLQRDQNHLIKKMNSLVANHHT